MIRAKLNYRFQLFWRMFLVYLLMKSQAEIVVIVTKSHMRPNVQMGKIVVASGVLKFHVTQLFRGLFERVLT